MARSDLSVWSTFAWTGGGDTLFFVSDDSRGMMVGRIRGDQTEVARVPIRNNAGNLLSCHGPRLGRSWFGLPTDRQEQSSTECPRSPGWWQVDAQARTFSHTSPEVELRVNLMCQQPGAEKRNPVPHSLPGR